MISRAGPIYQLADIASNLVDVSLQNVMAQLQCLLSVQLPFLSAEPEGQESVTAPDRQTDRQISENLFLPPYFHSHPVAANQLPGVAEEPVVLTLLSPHQPLPERGVV